MFALGKWENGCISKSQSRHRLAIVITFTIIITTTIIIPQQRKMFPWEILVTPQMGFAKERESGQFLGETKSFISDSDIVDAFCLMPKSKQEKGLDYYTSALPLW